jgi:hypothetical protein
MEREGRAHLQVHPVDVCEEPSRAEPAVRGVALYAPPVLELPLKLRDPLRGHAEFLIVPTES